VNFSRLFDEWIVIDNAFAPESTSASASASARILQQHTTLSRVVSPVQGLPFAAMKGLASSFKDSRQCVCARTGHRSL
jgi:hypothetical protein